MRPATSLNRELDEIEALLLKKFQEEPFHNFYLLYGKQPQSAQFGGTCSDKTMSFIAALKFKGFDASLHTGFIGGKEIHRLARVMIKNKVYFADVGNGWPSLKLYPADEEICFSCFGMDFRTEISDKIVVYHTREKIDSFTCNNSKIIKPVRKESLQLEINPSPRAEEEIKRMIEQRYDRKNAYPFNDSRRFSLVVDGKFLFLRGDQLEVYSSEGLEIVDGITEERVPEILKEYFRYDLVPLYNYLNLSIN